MGLRLPIWHAKRLHWWAACKGVAKTALAQNLLQEKIETNNSHIQEMLVELANDRGISIEELKAQILQDAGIELLPEEDDESE